MGGFGKDVFVDLKSIILSKISEEELFRHYVKSDFIINKPFSSPFRTDSSPSCTITIFRNRLRFKDFGNGDYDGDIFTIVGKIFNLSYKDTLYKINNDFNLKSLPIKHKIEENNVYIQEEEVETRIYPVIRKWFIRDREYWAGLGITLDELNKKNIFPLKSFKVINKRGEWEFDVENQFSYGLKSDYKDKLDNNKWKIKQPYNKKCKWISNIPNSYIEKYKGLDTRILLITKSRNDCIIWDKIIDCDKWVLQSEKIPLSNQDIIDINKHYELVIVCLDNDPTGIECSQKLVNQINNSFSVINITDKLEYNDPVEYSKNKQLIRLVDMIDGIIQNFDFLPF